jgi:cephalosporin hydroxylase
MKQRWMLMLIATLGLVVLGMLLKWPQEKPVSREQIIARFIQIYHTSNVHNNTRWLGIQAQQSPCDMWTDQEVISEVKPDFIIETGTYKGGGTLFLATVLKNINASGKVITVDIERQMERAAQLSLFQETVEFIEGDSVSEEVIGLIADRVKGARAVVILDSDHHKQHVLKELRLYSRFVSPGSYLIVHDTSHNGHPLKTSYGEGPMEAVEEFLAENESFVSDRSREKFLMTFSPMGYLKRIG